jgi:hypothetical protein
MDMLPLTWLPAIHSKYGAFPEQMSKTRRSYFGTLLSQQRNEFQLLKFM